MNSHDFRDMNEINLKLFGFNNYYDTQSNHQFHNCIILNDDTKPLILQPVNLWLY